MSLRELEMLMFTWGDGWKLVEMRMVYWFDIFCIFGLNHV